MEVVKNTTNLGMRMAVYWKIHKLQDVDWSRTAHVQNPHDLKSAGINQQLWQESCVSKTRDWNFHGIIPIFITWAKSLKPKWRSDPPSCLYDNTER